MRPACRSGVRRAAHAQPAAPAGHACAAPGCIVQAARQQPAGGLAYSPCLHCLPQGEPELSGERSHEAEPAEPAEAGKPPPPPSRAELALAPAAAVAATARGALAAASTQLCALAASVSAYLACIVPVGAGVARRVVLGLTEVVGSLRVRALGAGRWVGGDG